MSGKTYADLVALCQFLPGPASSQVGMAVGLQRAGYLGMFPVWFAFTMPSVIALVLFALGVAFMGDISDAGWLAGLKAAADAVVAHAVFAALLVLLPVLVASADSTTAFIADTFYRAGALVFGGGHVVLLLLESATMPTGLVDHDTLLTGYGAAQAVPGPLFTFASFLGASAQGVHWRSGPWWASSPPCCTTLSSSPLWPRGHDGCSCCIVYRAAGVETAGVGGCDRRRHRFDRAVAQ